MGGDFTLSDDCHGTTHVGTNYAELPDFIEAIDLHVITFFEKNGTTEDDRFSGVSRKTVPMANIRAHPIFD